MHKSTAGILDPKWKLRGHIIVLALAVLVIVLTGVYIGVSPFITRPDIMAIPFAVKTIVILGYQLLSEHTQRFAKWRSLKASFILSCIEPVFWLTLVILKFMGIAKFCSGAGCAVTWITTLVAIVILTRGSRVESVVVTRRSHAKSRTGCQTCKRRRIKCDENRPSCRNCEKHAVTCDFVKPQASSASTPVPSHEGRGPGEPARFSLPPSQPSCDINMMDLELMHNFTTYTCTTMASDPAVRQLLRTTAIHMAVECEYIMRSILAVSALHLSRYRPRKKDSYLERAMQHHQVATSAALKLMTDLRAEECERLHIFSMLTIYYALACPVNNEVDLAPESPLIPHWWRLLHGMEPILRMLEPQTYRGVLTPLFDFGRSRMAPFLKTTPPRDPSLLVNIQSLIRRTCTDTHLMPIYDDMIEQLRRILGLILTPSQGIMDTAHVHSYSQSDRERPGGSQLPSINAILTPGLPAAAAPAASPALANLEAWDILIWQWTQGKDFLPLLEAVTPPQEAVVIFAYCLLVLRKLENQWWAEGWADHLMGKTWALLDEEHRHWVVWATEEMGWIPPR
ncbi:sterol uptake control protein 2 [Chaetomidium leptoderma]|uniref:Sterol uptake control protein 2 n=1 Tax=Chaetomidium leptoderma TaxID=669021 RepID=A0AAN6VG80_9PEZI|nr:sterol uptake control protein 2 [Chaetomidium leptoderma]